jgi:two-component system response regulator TctD
MRLLLVEDDEALAQGLRLALERRDFEVDWCADGVQALMHLRNHQPALVLLDLTIPGMEGLKGPILVLTARGAVGDRVQGLNAGADDYLAKPFDLDELEARIRALLRRAHGKDGTERLSCGRLAMDTESGAVYLDGCLLELTPREHSLLKALMQRPGHAVSKDRLFRILFPREHEVQYSATDVVAYRLRKKLQGSGVSLVTLRGLGYLLHEDVPKDTSHTT